MRAEFIIAEKEFRDHLTSKRFLVILAVLLLVAVYGMATGLDQYNKSLAQYKNDKAGGASRFQEAVGYQQKILDAAVERGAPASEIEMYKAELQNVKDQRDYFLNPSMPTLLQVFQSFVWLFAILGMVLGIALGFDQLTKEKESGSLKSVLMAPVYRDSLINGKALGSMATLAAAMGIAFLVTIAVMLFYGVVPGLEDIIRVFLFFIASVLYCTAFFAIAMLMSTLSRNSAMAIVGAIGIVFGLIIVSFLSMLIANSVASAIVGPAPESAYTSIPTYSGHGYAVYGTNLTNNSTILVPTMGGNDYFTKVEQLRNQISDMLNVVSPVYDFMGMGSIYPGIAQALLSNDKPMYSYASYGSYTYSSSGVPNHQATLLDSLSYIWVKTLVLGLETLVAFALSYAIVMRMDVR